MLLSHLLPPSQLSEENDPHLFYIVLPLLPQISQLLFHWEMGALILFRMRTAGQIIFAVCYIHIKLEKIIYLCGMKLYLPNKQIKSRTYYISRDLVC